MYGLSAPPKSTPDQLRNDIDSGRTGDKVRAFDPSAVPLGTDAEAAGTPLDGDAIAAARREERSSRPTAPSDSRQFRPLLSSALAATVSLGALAVLLWAMFS